MHPSDTTKPIGRLRYSFAVIAFVVSNFLSLSLIFRSLFPDQKTILDIFFVFSGLLFLCLLLLKKSWAQWGAIIATPLLLYFSILIFLLFSGIYMDIFINGHIYSDRFSMHPTGKTFKLYYFLHVAQFISCILVFMYFRRINLDEQRIRRFYAAFIDTIPVYIYTFFSIATLFIFLYSNYVSEKIFLSLPYILFIQLGLSGFIAIVWGILDIILILRRSQTVGKYLMNINVGDVKTQKRTGFLRYVFLRSILGGTAFGLTILAYFFLPEEYGAGLVLLYFIVDSLFIFRQDRRTIHDMIAKTAVAVLPQEERRKSFFDFHSLPK